jgi:UDP-glucose 4-epimerase
MNKILVTGGAGLVGSNLCEKLALDPNNDIYSLDNYFTGSKENHVMGVTYIEGSTENIEALITFIPDIIYHLGEYSRVEQSFEDIDLVWKMNRDGIISVLDFVRKHKCKIVYAGSSTKFGDDGAGRNASPYAWSKASNTELVKNYGDWFGISYAITYFYNVYGNREIKNGKYATLIALFQQKTLASEDLTVVKPGTQLRNFTHVNDIINGLILVGEKGAGDGYGIGNPEAYSVLDIANMFGGKVRLIPERSGNRLTAEVITSKVKELGWKAECSIVDYINNWKKDSGINNTQL